MPLAKQVNFSEEVCLRVFESYEMALLTRREVEEVRITWKIKEEMIKFDFFGSIEEMLPDFKLVESSRRGLCLLPKSTYLFPDTSVVYNLYSKNEKFILPYYGFGKLQKDKRAHIIGGLYKDGKDLARMVSQIYSFFKYFDEGVPLGAMFRGACLGLLVSLSAALFGIASPRVIPIVVAMGFLFPKWYKSYKIRRERVRLGKFYPCYLDGEALDYLMNERIDEAEAGKDVKNLQEIMFKYKNTEWALRACLVIGNYYKDIGNYREAIEGYSYAIHSDSSRGIQQKGLAQLEMAACYERLGNYDQAIKEYDTFVRMFRVSKELNKMALEGIKRCKQKLGR